MPAVYLGSASTARRDILKALNYDVIVRPSHADEKLTDEARTVEELVTGITKMKTDACFEEIVGSIEGRQSDILVCGDIVVIDAERRPYGKPRSADEAKAFVGSFNRGMKLGTVQALELANLRTGQRVCGTDEAWCYLKRPIPLDATFDQYLEKEGAMHAAGGIIVECEFVDACVDHYEGERESIMGLSPKLLNRLMSMLQTEEAHVE